MFLKNHFHKILFVFLSISHTFPMEQTFNSKNLNKLNSILASQTEENKSLITIELSDLFYDLNDLEKEIAIKKAKKNGIRLLGISESSDDSFIEISEDDTILEDIYYNEYFDEESQEKDNKASEKQISCKSSNEAANILEKIFYNLSLIQKELENYLKKQSILNQENQKLKNENLQIKSENQTLKSQVNELSQNKLPKIKVSFHDIKSKERKLRVAKILSNQNKNLKEEVNQLKKKFIKREMQ